MASPIIQIRRSAVPGKIPTATQLSLGELALNTYDGKFYVKQDQGAVGVGTTVIAINPWNVGVGSAAYNINFTAGSVGIGTTNPGSTLTVGGAVQIQQDSSSNNRLIFRGQPGSPYRWNIDNYSSSNQFRIFREDDATSANGAVAVSISTTGTVTATRFSGDGSLLTGITASNSGVVVQNQGSTVGTAGTLNFSTNLSASFASGTATISLSNNPSISGILTADQVYTSNNGNGTNVRIGDDLWIGDVNVANTTRFSGVQDSTQAFVIFGSSNAVALGRTGTGPLYYGGNFTAAGIITAASFSGNASSATYASTAGVSTDVVGGIASVTQLNVSGVSTVGFITASNLYVAGVGTFLSSGLKIRNPANTFGYTITGDAIAADRTLTLPLVTANTGIAVTGLAQTFTAAQTFNGGATVNGLTGQGSITFNASVGNFTATSYTTGTVAIGGPSQTGQITLGLSTVTHTLGISTGASGVGTTKTINFGTGGLSGSFTQINIGPTAGVGTITINTGTNLGIGSTTPTSKLDIVGDAKFTGVVTATSFSGNASSATYASTAGIATYATNAGIATYATTAGISTSVIGGIGSITSLNVSGITTLGTIRISSGIVTAASGVVTYYGDGSNLTGISAIARVTVSQTAPSSPTAGDLWYHTTLARLFVYFNDGDSSQWVDAAPFNLQGSGAAAVSVGATAPTGPSSGDLWYNSNYGRLFVYYKDGDSDQWVDAAPFNFAGLTTSTYTETSLIATAGQTTFSANYDIGYVQVYLNGIRLTSTEYTAATGTSIVLAEPASLGDVVDILNVATNRGPTGPQGATGATTLAGIGTTSATTAHFPVFVSGLGNTTPLISTTSNYFSFIPSSGTLSVNQFNAGVTTATNVTVQSLNCSGVATATDFNSTSDINLKDNIKVIDDPLAKVLQLNGVSFDWKDTGQSSAGVIAQDVERVMPGIIRDNSTGYKSLNYNGLIGLLIEAVKEQNETIEVLKQKINTLEERLG